MSKEAVEEKGEEEKELEEEVIFKTRLKIPVEDFTYNKRARKAIRYIREKVRRLIRKKLRELQKEGQELELKISPELNELIWSKGINNVPRKIDISVIHRKWDDEEDLIIVPGIVSEEIETEESKSEHKR